MSDKEPISPTKIEGGAKAKKARDSTSSGNHDGKGKASGKKKGHRKGKSGGKRKDLFVDLWDRPKHEIESELKDLIRRRTVAEQEFEAVQGERQRQIRIAQAIRGVIVDTKNIRSEHKGVITEIGERENLIRDMRKRRDEINEQVVIPLKNIEEELVKTYVQLTEERKDLRYPNVAEEKKLFSFFFELQAMHPLAVESNELHHERSDLIEQQRDSIKVLRQKESEHDQVVQSIKDTDPTIKKIKATPWEEKAYNRRIAKLLEELNAKRKELKDLRREVGRLEAFIRVDRKKQEKGGFRHSRRRRGPNVEEVKRKAASGESISLDDLSALLDSGGFDSIVGSNTSADSKRKRKGKQTKRFGASRGEAKTGRPDRSD